jgi:hypothetical protein
MREIPKNQAWVHWPSQSQVKLGGSTETSPAYDVASRTPLSRVRYDNSASLKEFYITSPSVHTWALPSTLFAGDSD